MICYPTKCRISSEATSFWIKNEQEAREFLIKHFMMHTKVNAIDIGLISSEICPYFWASSDGLLGYSCCNTKYVLKIKCSLANLDKKVSALELLM